ncbi:MAG: glycosyltransferase family 4 protein [Phycisphaerae bacterium]
MEKKIKVLMVQRNYPHYRQAIFQKLATHPMIDFTLLYGDQAGVGGIENVENDPIVNCVVKPVSCLPLTQKKISVFPYMYEYVRNGDYDVLIVANDLYCLNLLPALKVARKRGKKICIFSIGFPQYRQWLRDKVRIWLAHKVDAMILYSYAHRQRYIDSGVPGEKIFVAPNAVDVDSIVAAEAKMTNETLENFKKKNGFAGNPTIIHAGRLVENKRLDILIKAIAKIVKTIPNIKFISIGDGPMMITWQKLAQQLGVSENIHWPGSIVEQGELCYWFHSSDICVAPGQQGLIANLCHAYGLPLITSDCSRLQGPEIQVFTNGKTGLFYLYEDVDDLVAKMEELLNNRERRLQMGNEARRRIFEDFTVDKMCQGFIDGINYALNKRYEIP